MSWKAIETSREIRQWAKILVPVAFGLFYISIMHPEAFDIFKRKKGEKNENSQTL